MAFVSWTEELRRFKDALARVPIDQLLMAGHTTKTGETITFRNLKDIENHLHFLEQKASGESAVVSKRVGPVYVGFRGR